MMVESTRKSIIRQRDYFLLLICITCVVVTPCHTSNILYFLPFGSSSHMITVLPALDALNDRGHNVTLLSLFIPSSETQTNITVLPLPELDKWFNAYYPNIQHMREFNLTAIHYFLTTMITTHCSALLEDPSFIKVATDKNTKYDVIMIDPLFAYCGLSLVWLLDSPPMIYYFTTTVYAEQASMLGISSPPSYIPMTFAGFTNEMTFTERLANLLTQTFFNGFLNFYVIPTLNNIVREKHPKLPSLLDIEKNVSFLFANSHSASLDFPRPTATFLAEVAGIHCRAAKPLPKEIEDFIQGAGENGFIYFSLGTNVLGSHLPVEKLNGFIGAFKRMKQRVVWKFEDELQNLPENVRTFKWAPQQDILGQSKIKAFITQGGKLSIQEAIYHGVPMVGVPFLGEQLSNIKNIVRKGLGEELDYDNLSVESVYDTLTKIVSTSSYKDNVKRYSLLMQDRPMKAIDTIVYWVEYVIRHKGARHLRPRVDHLNFFQYFLLDVIAFIFLIVSLVCFILFKTVSFAIRLCCGNKKAHAVIITKKLQ